MSEERKKPGVAFWATMSLVAALFYPLSFGPAWWMASREKLPAKNFVHAFYRPLFSAVIKFDGPLRWWVALGSVSRERTIGDEYYFIWKDLIIQERRWPEFESP